MPHYWTENSAPLYFFTGTNMPVTSFLSGDADENAVYSVSTHPTQGATVINDHLTGEFTYTPYPDIQNLDEFKYQITYGDYTTPDKTVYINIDETNSLEQESRQNNISFDLYQNYPNPFNPETMINFVLHRDMNAKLVVYNSAGRLVRTLADGFLNSGTYKLKWDGKDKNGSSMSSGVYYFMLKTDGISKMKKALLIK
ncbi:MAG: FlgD immunoglobulin-like domain containing protein [Candidatus Delongbacteria bacterium]